MALRNDKKDIDNSADPLKHFEDSVANVSFVDLVFAQGHLNPLPPFSKQSICLLLHQKNYSVQHPYISKHNLLSVCFNKKGSWQIL